MHLSPPERSTPYPNPDMAGNLQQHPLPAPPLFASPGAGGTVPAGVTARALAGAGEPASLPSAQTPAPLPSLAAMTASMPIVLAPDAEKAGMAFINDGLEKIASGDLPQEQVLPFVLQAFRHVIRQGDAVLAQDLLQRFPECLAMPDDRGCQLLHHASNHGKNAILRLLIAAGATLDTPCKAGQTAAMYAARARQLDSLKLLLKAGCDPAISNAKGRNLLTFAARKNDMALLNVIAAHVDNLTALDAPDGRGSTALALSAFHGHTGFMRRLIELGAKVDSPDGRGCRALHHAVLGRQLACVNMLIENKSEVDTRHGGQIPPLLLATALHDVELVKCLAEISTFGHSFTQFRGTGLLNHAGYIAMHAGRDATLSILTAEFEAYFLADQEYETEALEKLEQQFAASETLFNRFDKGLKLLLGGSACAAAVAGVVFAAPLATAFFGSSFFWLGVLNARFHNEQGKNDRHAGSQGRSIHPGLKKMLDAASLDVLAVDLKLAQMSRSGAAFIALPERIFADLLALFEQPREEASPGRLRSVVVEKLTAGHLMPALVAHTFADGFVDVCLKWSRYKVWSAARGARVTSMQARNCLATFMSNLQGLRQCRFEPAFAETAYRVFAAGSQSQYPDQAGVDLLERLARNAAQVLLSTGTRFSHGLSSLFNNLTTLMFYLKEKQAGSVAMILGQRFGLLWELATMIEGVWDRMAGDEDIYSRFPVALLQRLASAEFRTSVARLPDGCQLILDGQIRTLQFFCQRQPLPFPKVRKAELLALSAMND